MKKDSAFLWIMTLMLIVTGVTLSATSSRASELDRQLELCNVNRQPGDKVTDVRFNGYGRSENEVVFAVALDVDATHLPGEEVSIAVLAFDRDGNNLSSSNVSVPMPLSAHIGLTSTGTTLKSGASLALVDRLLVLIEGASPQGTFKFCDIFHNANGAWVPGLPTDVPQSEAPPTDVPQPEVPPVKPPVAEGPGYGLSLHPVVASIEACSYLENTNLNSPGPPRCMGRGGGRNGFWGQAPWILIHFQGLSTGSHKLQLRMKGRNRQGVYTNLGSRDYTFTNREQSWYLWLRSPHVVGKDYAPLYFTFRLDHAGSVGKIELTGSFE